MLWLGLDRHSSTDPGAFGDHAALSVVWFCRSIKPGSANNRLRLNHNGTGIKAELDTTGADHSCMNAGQHPSASLFGSEYKTAIQIFT